MRIQAYRVGRARHNLRQALSKLRGLGADLVENRGDRVALDPASCRIDVIAFEKPAHSGDVADLQQTLDLYRGDLLEGYSSNEAEFQDWLQLERDRLRKIEWNLWRELGTIAVQRTTVFAPRVVRRDIPMKAVVPLFALLLSIASTGQTASLTTIDLHNRPAAEIIPIIEPLLEPGDAISGAGFKIFLRASPATLAEVRAVIDSLDTAAKTLLISVFQGSDRELRNLAASGSIRIENGSISGEVAAGESRQQTTSEPVHRLRITEGKAGYIETGARIPLFSASGTSAYADATSGFYVLPRVHGDNVSLKSARFATRRAAPLAGLSRRCRPTPRSAAGSVNGCPSAASPSVSNNRAATVSIIVRRRDDNSTASG